MFADLWLRLGVGRLKRGLKQWISRQTKDEGLFQFRESYVFLTKKI